MLSKTEGSPKMIKWFKSRFTKLFGFAKSKVSESVNLKHQFYLYADRLLQEMRDGVKKKSDSEIDAFFEQKRAELKTYWGED